MSMSARIADYRRFCADAPADFPVFMKDWYLDAVCDGGIWDAAIAEKNGRIVGVWPWFLKKKGMWQYIAMPAMGKLMGPYIVPDQREISSEMKILSDLLAQIPQNLAAFEQDCNYTFQNWLPMYWQGFTQTTRYSYTMDLNKPIDQLWSGLESDYRRKINKANNSLEVFHDGSIEDLFEVSMQSFSRQGLGKPFGFEYFKKIHDSFESHNACEKFFARNRETGEIYSAGYLVWDKSTAYAYLGGDSTAFRSSGSGILLLWERIRYTKEVLQLPVFDFLGSMMKNIEPGRRNFGAVQQPYFRLQKEGSVLWKWGKSLLR